MSTAELSKPKSESRTLPPLEAGDHLDQKTFHERYKQMPNGFRAELIGGTVIVPSPLSTKHGRFHSFVNSWLSIYWSKTPGTWVQDNTTTIMSDDSEPQPDLSLIIDPDFGGPTRDSEDGYSTGPPELIVEVVSSSETYDLHEKYSDYEAAGVLEYVVILIRQKEIRWFRLREGKYQQVASDANGIFRSDVFPGLWLNAPAFFHFEPLDVFSTLELGLLTPEHQEFVERLANQNRRQD